MKSLTDILGEARFVASADYEISTSGRKVHKYKKIADTSYVEPKEDDEDEEDKKKVKESLDEAVTVKKDKYSWGKMVTVHHGSDTSYPLHPEHQEAIKKLKDGEHTSFTDETNRKVSAHREGDSVHLSAKGTNKKTTVAHSHFNESVEQIEEAIDKQDTRLMQLARLGLVDKESVSKLHIAMSALKAEKPLSIAQRTLLLNVTEELISLVTGDDMVFSRVKLDVQKESKDDVPFDGPYTKTPTEVKDKSGAVHTPQSRARHLARIALQAQKKKSK